MNREERFHRSVNVLATAYREGTLASEDCVVCAVGNLCADSLNLRVVITAWGAYQWQDTDGFVYDNSGAWYNPMFSSRAEGPSWEYIDGKSNGMAQIHATGYTLVELDRVERAFELACGIARGEMDMDGTIIDEFEYSEVSTEVEQYAGLVAVYEVLCQIHEVPVVDQVEPSTLFFKVEQPEYEAEMVKIEV